MDTIDKQHKQSERKTGRSTNFATDLSTKKAIGGNSLPISCTLCSKAHHLDECAEFLKKPLEDRRDFIKDYVLVATVPTTLPSFAEINDPVRPATRDTRRHFMVTAGSQKERTSNIRNQKWERKTKLSMRTPQSAM